jgi:hypothetical protein
MKKTLTPKQKQRALDALQIEEYIATNCSGQRPGRRDRQSRKLIQNFLFTTLLLRAAGIEADGNDTAGKVKIAIAKLTKNKRGAPCAAAPSLDLTVSAPRVQETPQSRPC